MGDVQAESVLAKFVKNGEWDFHHVEAVRHNSLFALHDNENDTRKAGTIETNKFANNLYW